MGITSKLKELEKELLAAKYPVLDFLSNGLRREDIISLFEKESLHPSNELIELYQWKNGLRDKDIPVGMLCFGVHGVFVQLEESIEIYGASKEDNLVNYFPIFSDDSFLIQLDRQSKDLGKIFIYCPSIQINEPMSYFDSLESMIETFIICFKERIFFYDEKGYFDQDYDKSSEVAKKINPDSAYWNL